MNMWSSDTVPTQN